MTRTPHDALFKAAFRHRAHARALVDRFFPALTSANVVWATLKGESTSFIGPVLDGKRSDLLFSVQIDGRKAYIYFLLEHQSTVDYDMAFRVLVYLVRIWERHRTDHPSGPLPLILAAVISNAPNGWTGPLSFHDLCTPHPTSIPGIAHLIPHFTLHLEDLSQRTNEELQSWTLASFPKAALYLLRDARDPVKLLQNFHQWASFFAAAAQAPTGMDAIAQVLTYISLVSRDLNMDEFRATLRQHLPPAAEAELMTIWEQAHHEGRQKGLQEGRQEGLQELLAKQLTLKFGELPSEYATRLRAATFEDIERYAERILTADSPAAVFGDPT